MKSIIFRITQIVVFILLVSYVAIREYTSPWIFSFLAEEEVSESTDFSNSAASNNQGSSEVPEILKDNLNDSLTKAYALLSTKLESQLQNRIIYLQQLNTSQQLSFEETKNAVSVSVDNLRRNTEKSLADIESSLRLVQETEAQVEAAREDLDKAQANLFDMSASIAEIQSFTNELLDERNYDFKSYAVGFNESLTDIVAKLQRLYEIPETDLRELIIRFNDVETKFVSGGNKRPDVRVVTNKDLRIPIPKKTGTLLAESEVPKQLEEQIAVIKRAQARYNAIQKNLKLQVRRLQSIDISIKAMQNLADGIEEVFANVDFASDSWMDNQIEMSDDQKNAWLAFDEAVKEFNFADSIESKNLSRRNLEKATQNLITVYASTEIETQEKEDPLLWYNSFIDRYFEEGN